MESRAIGNVTRSHSLGDRKKSRQNFAKYLHKLIDLEEKESLDAVCERSTFMRQHLSVNIAIKKFSLEFIFPKEFIENEPQFDVIEDANNECIDC